LGRRQLLAHLNAGPRASADPTAFARTLALDHSVQQDGQEFMKLLLTLLERLLRESGNQVIVHVRNRNQRLFLMAAAASGGCG
jgi:hypothetical protein